MSVAVWLIFGWFAMWGLLVLVTLGAAVLHLGDLKAMMRTVIAQQRGKFVCPGCGLAVERVEP